MHALGIALIASGAIYLTAVAVWTGGLPPFWRADARRQGRSYDRARAQQLTGWHLLAAIAAVLVGIFLLSAG